MTPDYDMIVLGAGAAGLTAAGMSALLGARTALIEEHRLGGECTWTGCIPSKTLLKSAQVAHLIRTADRFGLNPAVQEVPFSRLMEHVRDVRQQVYTDADAPPNVEKLGVEVIVGHARFVDPSTIEIRPPSGPLQRLSARYFVIATGSRPRLPKFDEPCLTNETVFELTTQPKRLVVIGAGPVGLEMAQAFQRLGSAVTIVAPTGRILPKDDPEHAKILLDCLSDEGVSFCLNRRVVKLQKGPTGLRAGLDDGSMLDCDAALAASGREANVAHLDLEKAGVQTGRDGIEIDSRCRTSQRHIFASGDVTPRYRFTHMAEHMSKVAVTNAILRWPTKLDDKHIVWSTYTDPEIAQIGESEAALDKRGARYSVYRFPFHKLDRAITDRQTNGQIKVFACRAGRILGAAIVGAYAGEMISEYALAMRNGLKLSQLSRTIHPYPTYLLGNRRTADQATWKQLDSPLLALLGKILGYRGVRRGSAVL
jgi:pyruvate/2-oxoglutarate dehydrogenase complex dihydrolipoamide dehydrogenase (E3) component